MGSSTSSDPSGLEIGARCRRPGLWRRFPEPRTIAVDAAGLTEIDVFESVFPCSLVRILACARRPLLQCLCVWFRGLPCAAVKPQGKASSKVAVDHSRVGCSQAETAHAHAAPFDWLGLRQISTPLERTLSAAQCPLTLVDLCDCSPAARLCPRPDPGLLPGALSRAPDGPFRPPWTAPARSTRSLKRRAAAAAAEALPYPPLAALRTAGLAA